MQSSFRYKQMQIIATFSINVFLPSVIFKSNKLDNSIRNSDIFSTFEMKLLEFLITVSTRFYTCHYLEEVKLLLIPLKLGLSHIQNYQTFSTESAGVVQLNPVHIKFATSHFIWTTRAFHDKILHFYPNIFDQSDSAITQIILFGGTVLYDKKRPVF